MSGLLKHKWLVYLAITVLISIIFNTLGRLSVGFAEWYASVIYPLVVGFWGRITGIFPFAAVEILLYLLILAVFAVIVFLIIKLVKGKGRRAKILLRAGIALSCTISTLMMMFTFGAGINYHRRPFSEHSGLEVGEFTAEDLRAVIVEVIEELEALVPQINTCENGSFILDKTEFNATARQAMRRLGEIYPVLDTYYPRPKPVLFSRQVLSPLFIGGVFSPFTIEVLYNNDMPDSSKPFTALHELSHLSGFMREDEANFIAFLACRESDNVDFRYSGYMNALWALLGAYAGDAEWEDLSELYMSIPEQVIMQDRTDTDYWWSFYNAPGGAAIAAISNAVNDTYLKVQGQEDGVKSYGRVVDLLIADYLARRG
jgi:hypothetical protein